MFNIKLENNRYSVYYNGYYIDSFDSYNDAYDYMVLSEYEMNDYSDIGCEFDGRIGV